MLRKWLQFIHIVTKLFSSAKVYILSLNNEDKAGGPKLGHTIIFDLSLCYDVLGSIIELGTVYIF